MAVCENCAGEDEELAPVWPGAVDSEEPQLWCSACRSSYPNDPAESGDDEG